MPGLLGSHKLSSPLDRNKQIKICVADMIKDGASGALLKYIYKAEYVEGTAGLDWLKNQIKLKMLDLAKRNTPSTYLIK